MYCRRFAWSRSGRSSYETRPSCVWAGQYRKDKPVFRIGPGPPHWQEEIETLQRRADGEGGGSEKEISPGPRVSRLRMSPCAVGDLAESASGSQSLRARRIRRARLIHVLCQTSLICFLLWPGPGSSYREHNELCCAPGARRFPQSSEETC